MSDFIDTEKYRSEAWRLACSAAIEDPRMRFAYFIDSGVEFIDSARYIISFTRWFTETHWGIENAPDGVRRSLFGGRQ